MEISSTAISLQDGTKIFIQSMSFQNCSLEDNKNYPTSQTAEHREAHPVLPCLFQYSQQPIRCRLRDKFSLSASSRADQKQLRPIQRPLARPLTNHQSLELPSLWISGLASVAGS
jgi:hypothetical protein